MAHGRNHRDLGGVDRSRHTLVVERPKILNRTAAAAGDDEIGHMKLVGIADGPGDLRRRFDTLNADRQQYDLRHRPAPTEDADHVVDSRSGRGGNDRDLLRKRGQPLFMGLIEQTFSRELCFQLFEGDLQVSRAFRHDRDAVELILPVPRKYADPTGNDDAHPVFRAKAKLRGAAFEHHASEAARAVLQREVMMPRGIDLVIGQLASDSHIEQQSVGIQQNGCSSARTKLPRMPLTKATVSGAS